MMPSPTVFRPALRTALVLLPLLLAAAAAAAQPRGPRGVRPLQSLSLGYQLVDFDFNGEGEPETSFAFSEPVFGAVYTRPNLLASIAFGEEAAPPDAEDARPQQLLDASLTTWGALGLLEESAGRTRLFIPVALHSNYRRVSREGSENSIVDAFNVTVLGLGAGVGFAGSLGERLSVEARATPVLGLALRAFGDAAGHARLVDTDVQLNIGRLFGRFGLSAGYGFRLQVWNVSSSDLFADLGSDLYDYRGTHHAFRVGVNW